MFDRFDQDARAAIAKARDEANRAGRREIGTEHLLLGLMAKPGDAAGALTAVQADPAEVRASLPQRDADTGAAADSGRQPAAHTVPAPGGGGENLHLTNNARRALDLALRTAHRFRHEHVSSGHLLFSIIEQPDSGAAEALKVAGIHVGTLRTDILRQLTQTPARGTPHAPPSSAPPSPDLAPGLDLAPGQD